MRAALLLSILALLSVLVAAGPAGAENWIALWLIGDDFLGMTGNGEVYRYIPSTGEVVSAGSLGSGPWVSFGRQDEQLLALKSDVEVWAMPGSGGAAALYRALPADREWCALQQHPDLQPWLAISCDGEIWNLSAPPQMLADVGAYASGRWSAWGSCERLLTGIPA
jgi:hypothetical protein